MDPITLGLLAAVAVVVVATKKPVQTAVAQGQRHEVDGAGNLLSGIPPPPPPPDPSDIAGVLFTGSAQVARGARAVMGGALLNIQATASQRAQGPTGGLDPAFVDSGSAVAARQYMNRGLEVAPVAVAAALGPAGLAAYGFAQTRTGKAVVNAAQRTGAEVLAAGGSAAQAVAQSTVNAAATVAAAADDADAATANFISNNTPSFLR